MPVYDNDVVWDDLVRLAGTTGSRLLDTIEFAKRIYDKWSSLAGAKSDATIAAALSRVEADVTDLRASFDRFNEIYGFVNNAASPTQADREADIIKFVS